MFAETCRLVKAERLNRPQDYKRVFESSGSSSDETFLTVYRENKLNYARLGLAIAKKHLKRAVDRNCVKRKIRESFRLNKKILQGFDIVVISRKKQKNLSKIKITKSINKHWQHISQCRKSC